MTVLPRSARSAGWHVLCLVIVAVVLYPLVWLAFASVKPPDEILSRLALLPTRLVFDGYSKGWEGAADVGFGRFFLNSFLVAGLSVAANVLSCSLAAFAFARLKFRFRGALFAFMITTLMLPYHVTLIPQYVIFQQAGLVNTFVPLVLPKLLATEAFFVFLIVQFMRGIPRELDEAATIDGCSVYRTFWHVVLPLSKPALVTTSIFTFIWTWNDFFTQMVYLNDTEKFTVPLGLRLFVDTSSESNFGAMFAMSALALVPIVLFFLAFQRLLVEGVSTSGLKG
ncbi:Predicted rhamnose oligosaccharide ABC transport system [Amycolatopsis camponoti]|uniref:Predicted rhamnose oligosaccharide ABC transport system n=1 Tax=Amycolatopsis camponoti TaxID=2606593 RepID=A0A6I8LP70_9PSEU|nr:carbohydrate ABC transporter permease [Amycolatopsis camponoti]VVJ18810.1 Predicted rhamnose oligosaccharide ABC transport system [Amycolatopsis camponoti]